MSNAIATWSGDYYQVFAIILFVIGFISLLLHKNLI